MSPLARMDKKSLVGVPHYHFDGEAFTETNHRINLLKENLIAEITKSPPDGKIARKWLGEALHAVQDYYSHSTWVEIQLEDNIYPTNLMLGIIYLFHETFQRLVVFVLRTVQWHLGNIFILLVIGLSQMFVIP